MEVRGAPPPPITLQTTTHKTNLNNYETQFQTKALEATIAIHNQIKSSEEFAGYEGNIDAFNTLYKEVYVIVRQELFEDADIELVIETFFWYQSEIADGEREIDWWMY